MHSVRRYVLLAIAGIPLALGACGTTPASRDDVLDPRLAGPCERLALSWSESASRLQALMGHGFKPRTADAVGEVQLNLLRCDPQNRRQPPLAFAFLSVPLSAESAPLVITQMPDDGWAWLPAVIVNSDSSAVFSAMGYQVEPAEILFELERSGNHVSITAQLVFASGGLSIAAKTAGKETAHSANQALVSADPQYHSVFFGEETAARYALESIAVDVQGDTPLPAYDVHRKPASAVLDSGLRLDHVYWRLPRALPKPARSREP